MEIEPVILQNAETPVIVDQQQFTLELQKYYSGHNENSKKLEWSSERIQNVIKLLEDFNSAKLQGKRPTNKQYHHARKYDLMIVGNQKVLTVKRKAISDPVVQIIPTEEYYERILDAHIATGHGRRDKIVHALKDKYVVPIFAITIFLNLCKTCLSKKSFQKKVVAKPLVSDDLNRTGEMDLVDFQMSPDEEYKWLLHYQDHLTKFCFLRPLKSKQAKEVSIEILKIFLEVGCPSILQSDIGCDFTESVLKEIVTLWPACKIIHGRPRYPQSQGNIECSNHDIKNMIQAWMADNKSTNWSIGCYFVQFQRNLSYNSTIARTPFKALFGEDPKLGFSSIYLSKNVIPKLETDNSEIIADGLHKSNNESENISIVSKETKTSCQANPDLLRTNVSHLANAILNVTNSEIAEQNVALDEDIISSDSNITKHDIKDISIKIEAISSLICYICNKEASEGHTCINCKNIVHPICGVESEENEGYGTQLLCNLCVNGNIVQSRKQSHINLKRPADKMKATSSKKFKDISIGAPVLVEVPKADIDL